MNEVIKTYIGVFCFVGVFFAGVYLAPLFKTKLQSPNIPNPLISSRTKEECISAGGQWFRFDNPKSVPVCDMPTKDAGKSCTDSSQCEYRCMTTIPVRFDTKVTGQCSKYHFYTSIQLVRNGIAGPVMIE